MGCRMNYEWHQDQLSEYNPEGWRDTWHEPADEEFVPLHRSSPDVMDRSRVLDLLGRINYRILSGNKVYVEVDGVVYKTLYGAYWRSVFTGREHYLLKCEEISGPMWFAGNGETEVVDLPVAYSNGGWTARGHSLSFMLARGWV